VDLFFCCVEGEVPDVEGCRVFELVFEIVLGGSFSFPLAVFTICSIPASFAVLVSLALPVLYGG
jgi:hypothetical protein